MNDKYINPFFQEQHDEIVDAIMTHARSLKMTVGVGDTMKKLIACGDAWKRFCVLAKDVGWAIDDVLGQQVLDWAREYNQGNQGTVDVRIT